MLGTRTSTFTLTVAAQAADTMGVVIFSNDSRGRPQAIDSLRAVDALAIPVFYPGNAFIFIAADRTFPADTWAPASSQQAATIIKTLPPTVPRH